MQMIVARVQSSTLPKFFKAVEKLRLHYSRKNIFIPLETNYKLQLTGKFKQIINRMTCKGFFYSNHRGKMQQT